MSNLDVLNRVIESQVNYERARQLGLPVLRSLHRDAVLVAYSMLGVDGADSGVEANHAVLPTLEWSRPRTFSTRTVESNGDDETELTNHAIDHVMNNNPDWHQGWTRAQHAELRDRLAQSPRFRLTITVDGQPEEAEGFAFSDDGFARLRLPDRNVLVTLAVPMQFLDAGFTGSIGKTP